MTPLAITHIVPRSSQRVRVIFSGAVAPAALSPAFYTVVAQDSLGASPAVVAVLPVVGSPAVVELVLGDVLVNGGLYWIYAEGVPAIPYVSGSTGAISVIGSVTFTELAASFTAGMVGESITLLNALAPGNNGRFTITAFIDSRNIQYENALASGAEPNDGSLTWTIDSPTVAGAHESMRVGATTGPRPDAEPIVKNRELLLYGIDLIWDGIDFQRSATGDLNRVQGTACVAKNLNRGMVSNGLPWDPTWGAHAREFVDSPQGTVGTLKGSVQAQILRDPRIQSAKVTFEVVGSDTFLHAVPKLISGEAIKRVTLSVPNAS